MRLGIRGHDLGVKDFEKALQRLDELGIDGLQLVVYKTLEDVKYEVGQMNSLLADKINSLLTNHSKELYLLGAYFNPVHSNKDKVRLGIEVFEEYLSYATALGCDMVGSETGSFNDDKWTYHPLNRTEEALNEVVRIFSRLCETAEKYGCYVGMEGAFGHVCYDAATLKKAVERIGKKNIRIIFDTYNYLDYTNHERHIDILKEGLDLFGKDIYCFHMKDYIVGDGKLIQVPVGKGIMDYPSLLGAIKKHNHNALLILEGTVGDEISSSVKFIKELWGKV